MVFVHFQGKTFTITVIRIYTPNTNVKEADVEWFYEYLPDLLELIPQKYVLSIIGNWNAKVGSQELLGVTANLTLEYRMEQAKG